MTDQSNEPSRSPFSWLRDIFRLRKTRPTILRPSKDRALATREVQLDIIQRAFDEKIGVASGRGDDDGYLYHPERALVGADDVDAVERYFGDRPDVYRGTGSFDRLIDGLMLYEFPPRQSDGEVALLDDLDELDRELREGVATPDHILYVVPKGGSYCPATEPTLPPKPGPIPAVNKTSTAGTDVRVSVIDTGWYPDAAKDSDSLWLEKDVDGDVEQLNPPDVIHEYAGHGTFVAGVVKCMAPSTKIKIEGALLRGGAVYESDITAQLNEAMTDSKFDPHIITISAGTYTRKDLGLLGFQVLATLYKLAEGDEAVLVVAAAGNDSVSSPFFPAAFDWVLSVGSVDADGQLSDFSNFGPWVDVYAHGRDLVNAYPTGTYKYVEPKSPMYGKTENFTGLAQWSGTSFSTPVVTGSIAALIKPGMNARQARDALIAAAPRKQGPKAGTYSTLGPPFVT